MILSSKMDPQTRLVSRLSSSCIRDPYLIQQLPVQPAHELCKARCRSYRSRAESEGRVIQISRSRRGRSWLPQFTSEARDHSNSKQQTTTTTTNQRQQHPKKKQRWHNMKVVSVFSCEERRWCPAHLQFLLTYLLADLNLWASRSLHLFGGE